METQAAAPGQPQAQAPVHAIHAEQATHDALTQWVKNNPDNDPHAGTDLEAPPQEAEQTEEAAPAEEPETQEVELPEDDPLFEIEYKTETGKETKKLSLKELREGYLAKQDYHRNIQKVKAQEAELATKAREAEVRAAQQYTQRLEAHKQTLQRVSGVKSMQEIEQLSLSDPATAQHEFLKLVNFNQTMQQMDAELSAAQQRVQQQVHAAQAEALQRAQDTLASDVPGWGEELQKSLTKTAISDYGFKAEELAQVADARVIKLIHDAHQYRQLQKAKPELAKKVVAIPKVVKPGSVSSSSPAKEQADRAFARFQKTGKVEDAAAAYLSRQQKK